MSRSHWRRSWDGAGAVLSRKCGSRDILELLMYVAFWTGRARRMAVWPTHRRFGGPLGAPVQLGRLPQSKAPCRRRSQYRRGLVAVTVDVCTMVCPPLACNGTRPGVGVARFWEGGTTAAGSHRPMQTAAHTAWVSASHGSESPIIGRFADGCGSMHFQTGGTACPHRVGGLQSPVAALRTRRFTRWLRALRSMTQMALVEPSPSLQNAHVQVRILPREDRPA